MVGTGIAVASEPGSWNDWAEQEQFTLGTLGAEIPGSSHPACIRVGDSLHDKPADVRSDGQGKGAFAPTYHGDQTARQSTSASLPLPPEARVCKPHSQNPGGRLTWHFFCIVDRESGAHDIGLANSSSEWWHKWIPTGPGLRAKNKPGLVGSVRTRLQRFAVRDQRRHEESDRFGTSFAVVLNVVRCRSDGAFSHGWLYNGTTVARINPALAAQHGRGGWTTIMACNST